MHFNNIVALAAFATSALAGSPGQGPDLKPWKVTDLEWTASPGGTSDSFHVVGKADYGMPAFSVDCFATSYDKTYRKCHGNVANGAKVSSYWTFTDDGFANMYIKYQANGKTLIGGRLVKIEANDGETQHFKVYPAVQWDLTEREAESKNSMTWNVENLTLGASSGGSWDNVHISALPHRHIPGFSANCEATVYQTTWVPCRGADNGHKVSHYWEFTGRNKMTVHFKYETGDKTFIAQKTLPVPKDSSDFILAPERVEIIEN